MTKLYSLCLVWLYATQVLSWEDFVWSSSWLTGHFFTECIFITRPSLPTQSVCELQGCHHLGSF